MSHDKIKAAARKRMAATGEAYTTARRHAVGEHSAAYSAVSAEDIRAAAAAHGELGPEYSDAVVASFIENVDRAVAARVEARLADLAQSQPGSQGRRPLTRRVARDVLAAGAGALVMVGALGLHASSSHPKPPVSSVQVPGPRAELRALKPRGLPSAVLCKIVTSGNGSVTCGPAPKH